MKPTRSFINILYFVPFAIFITLFLCLIDSAVARAETEPNDSIAQANVIGIGLQNAEVGITIGSATDEDYFRFTAEAGRTYVIETYNIQGTGTDATGLWLYNSSGSLVTNDESGNNGTGNANARIIYTFVTSDTYYIAVSRARFRTWQGTYSLRILAKHNEPDAAWDAANDNEPNNVLELANEIQIGLSSAQTHQLFDHASFVTNKPDHDWYHFTAEAGRTYVIETYNIQGTGINATGLWLYNSSGSLVANDESGQQGTGDASARIVHTFVNQDLYYIEVRHDRFAAWQGTYSLRILPRHNEAGAAWEAANDNEPNGLLELANEIQIGLASAQTHRLFDHASFVTNDADYDWYRFNAEANRTYVIETYNIQGTGTNATGLWLYNSSGSLVANDESGRQGTGDANARIVHTFVNQDLYYIVVGHDRFAAWQGTYSLRILPRHDEPGAAWEATNDNEPNGLLELANEIVVGRDHAQTHRLFDHASFVTNDADHDWYYFTAAAGQTLILETFNVASTTRATGLWLYNNLGAEITSDPNGNSRTGTATITYNFITAGTYYLLVKDAQFQTWNGQYSVRVCVNSCQLAVYLPLVVR